MAITEIFPNATVKQVIFKIGFPNLFAMEKLIGDYQLKIMDRFPESQLIFKQPLFVTKAATDSDIQDSTNDHEMSGVQKMWQFESTDGIKLNVNTDSIDMSSESYKTYNNKAASNRFRDAIQFAIESFLEIVNIPKMNRVGLRYVDECPIQEETTAFFRSWYNSSLPLDRFSLEDALTMKFLAETKKDGNTLIFSETIMKRDGSLKYTLDFDAISQNINSSEYLTTTDALHDIISAEFENCGKPPFVEYLRGNSQRGTL